MAKSPKTTPAEREAMRVARYEASRAEQERQNNKIRSERIVHGTIQKTGGIVTFSAWGKRISGRGVYGAHYIAPDGTRQGMRSGGPLHSIDDAIRSAKALLVAQFGPITWSKAVTAGPSFGN